MARVYVTSRGHTGVSFGCLGLILMPFAYLLLIGFAAVMVLVLLTPFLCVLIIGGLNRAGDWALKVVPEYRARRERVGPIRWDTRTLASMAALFDKEKRRQMHWL